MAAGIYNLVIEIGATFDQTVTWTDEDGDAVDVSGYTAAMKVKSKIGGSTLVSLTDGDGITLGADGTIRIVIEAATTAALSAETAVYDLVLTSAAGKVTRLLQGRADISPSVSI